MISMDDKKANEDVRIENAVLAALRLVLGQSCRRIP